MSKTAIIKTKWQDRQGGYWEAEAYTTDMEPIRGLYATMLDELAAVSGLVNDLMREGYTDIQCHSQAIINLSVKHQGWDVS